MMCRCFQDVVHFSWAVGMPEAYCANHNTMQLFHAGTTSCIRVLQYDVPLVQGRCALQLGCGHAQGVLRESHHNAAVSRCAVDSRMYLEIIFVISEDICKQLPQKSLKFEGCCALSLDCGHY
jgi:hypothetical protein